MPTVARRRVGIPYRIVLLLCYPPIKAVLYGVLVLLGRVIHFIYSGLFVLGDFIVSSYNSLAKSFFLKINLTCIISQLFNLLPALLKITPSGFISNRPMQLLESVY